jgi:hypothetical protein
VKRAREQGQAMVEAAVILLLVVFLFLGVFYLGKFHDIQASTIQAARYAAWERTVHSQASLSDTRVQDQARARLFTWNQDPFKSSDGLADNSQWTRQTGVWYDHASAQRLIGRPADVTIGTAIGPLPGVAGNAMSSAFGVIGAFSGLAGGEALPRDGLATSTVAVKLANIDILPAPLNKMDLTLHEQSVVALDSWDASGPRQAALRSRSFTLAGPFTQLDSLLTPVEWALSWIEPSFRDLHIGQVCPDIVPADRLEGAAGLPAYRGGGACVR